jgi:hypothetical protein
MAGCMARDYIACIAAAVGAAAVVLCSVTAVLVVVHGVVGLAAARPSLDCALFAGTWCSWWSPWLPFSDGGNCLT